MNCRADSNAGGKLANKAESKGLSGTIVENDNEARTDLRRRPGNLEQQSPFLLVLSLEDTPCSSRHVARTKRQWPQVPTLRKVIAGSSHEVSPLLDNRSVLPSIPRHLLCSHHRLASSAWPERRAVKGV